MLTPAHRHAVSRIDIKLTLTRAGQKLREQTVLRKTDLPGRFRWGRPKHVRLGLGDQQILRYIVHGHQAFRGRYAAIRLVESAQITWLPGVACLNRAPACCSCPDNSTSYSRAAEAVNQGPYVRFLRHDFDRASELPRLGDVSAVVDDRRVATFGVK